MFDPFTMFLISAAMTIGSTIMQYQAAQKSQAQQMAAIQAASDRQLGYQKKINDILDEEVQKYDPNARMEDQAGLEADMNAGYDAALTKAKELGYGSVNPSMQGDVSSVYLKDVADATTKAGADATELARLMAKIGAGTRLRQNEALRFNDYTQRIGLVGNEAAGAGAVDQNLIKLAGIPDGKSQLLAGILGGLGTSGMTYGLNAGMAGGQPSNLFGTNQGLPATHQNYLFWDA